MKKQEIMDIASEYMTAISIANGGKKVRKVDVERTLSAMEQIIISVAQVLEVGEKVDLCNLIQLERKVIKGRKGIMNKLMDDGTVMEIPFDKQDRTVIEARPLGRLKNIQFVDELEEQVNDTEEIEISKD